MKTSGDTTMNPVHAWLRKVNIAFVPGPGRPLLHDASRQLLDRFRTDGALVQVRPDSTTDAILTTAEFGKPVAWRDALLFSSLRKFNLVKTPTLYTLVHARRDEVERLLDHFEKALRKPVAEPADFDFPGLGPGAHRVLFDQGRRGGPMMAFQRLVQAQARSIRVVLFVGEDQVRQAYHFDMVGGYPSSEGPDLYGDTLRRMLTILSTREVKEFTVTGEPIERELWDRLDTPPAMCRAGRQFGERGFFSDKVRVADLMDLPERLGRVFSDILAEQYSEGCFATWDPTLGGLITTITGVARPFDKDKLTEDELSVIVGVRPDGTGSVIREVEARRNDAPSSEAVELIDMDTDLPSIDLGAPWKVQARVPVARSKLHGHRGVAAYDPALVEFVRLDAAYYHYPVTCGTQAHAHGVRTAFTRSTTLRNSADRRPVAFTVLPGHGVVFVEKWVENKEPFQVLWEFMDSGAIVVEAAIPQGPMDYAEDSRGMCVLQKG